MNTSYLADRPGPAMGTKQALLLAGTTLTASLLAGIFISPIIAIIMGLTAIALSYWNLDRVFLPLIASMLLWPYTMYWQVGPLAIGPSRIIFFLLVVTWIYAWSNGKVKVYRTPLDLIFLIYVTTLFGSIAFNSPDMTSAQLSISIKKFVYIVFEWLLLFYIVSSMIKNWKDVRKASLFFVMIISLVAFLGVIEYFTEFRLFEWLRHLLPGGQNMASNIHESQLESKAPGLYRGGILRIVSSTISFQEVSTLMAMALPIGLYMLAYARSWRWTIFFSGVIGLIVTAMFLSVTRGGIIAAGVSIICLSIFSKKKFLRASIILALSTVVIAFIAFPAIPNSLLSVINPETIQQETSVQSRLQDWPQAIELLNGHEFIGVGQGLVSGHVLNYYASAINPSFMFTDNSYLTVLTENGILGIVGLLMVFATILLVLSKRRRSVEKISDEVYDLRIAILAAAVAYMVLCSTFSALTFMTVSKIFWLLVGLGFALVRLENQQDINKRVNIFSPHVE